jgi:pyridoxal phosphate enzyme (YggS family)
MLRSSAFSDNVKRVRENMARAAERSGRAPGEVTLVAVTKAHPAQTVYEAIEAGLTDFGENRVREAMYKFAGRGSRPLDADADASLLVPRRGVSLHMIGTLQRNKVRPAVALFDFIHSADRPELLHALDRAMAEDWPGDRLPVLLQVNITGEDSKSGIAPEDVAGMVETLARCPHLLGAGLMTIARLGADERELRSTFSTLRALLETARRDLPTMRHLSMGMTDDYEIAIEEGATMVRIGRAIFGERE